MLIPFNIGALAMNEEFRKEVFKRLEQMGLTKKDLFKREKALHKFYNSNLYHDKLIVDIEKDLGLIQCRKTDKSIRGFILWRR